MFGANPEKKMKAVESIEHGAPQPAAPAFALFQQLQRNALPPRHSRYEFECDSARGGTATVWRAYDRMLERYTAVKILLDSHDTDQMRARLRQEALICARLDHPGIVPVHELDQLEDGRPFVAMKWIEGDSLSVLLDRGGTSDSRRHTAAKLLPVFRKICEVVNHAHERSVIHRDLKPSNIFVSKFDVVHVMDWGIAKYLGNIEQTFDNESLPMQLDSMGTYHGAVMGTPSYMSPEQANGFNSLVDTRSDVFSLGCILFTILTGKQVYDGTSVESIKAEASGANLTPAIQLLRKSKCRRSLKRLAIQCLSSVPADRPKDAGAVLVKFDRATSNYRFRTICIWMVFVWPAIIVAMLFIEMVLFLWFGKVEIRNG